MKNFYLVLVGLLSQSSLALASGVPMRIATAQFGPMADYGAGAAYAPCSFDSHLEECLIDTGSDTSHIQFDSFSSAYTTVGQTTGGGLSGEPTTCDVIEIKQFLIGESVSDNQRMVLCHPPTNSTDGDIAQSSMVSLSIFSGKTLHFDFTGKIFSMSDVIPLGQSTLPLTIHQELGHFGFPVEVSGMQVDSVVDSGAAITVIDKQFIQTNPDAFTFIQSVSGGQDVNGDPILLNLYKVKSLAFAGLSLVNSYALGTDFSAISKFLPGVPVILGFNVLSQKNWYFDLNQKLWGFN